MLFAVIVLDVLQHVLKLSREDAKAGGQTRETTRGSSVSSPQDFVKKSRIILEYIRVTDEIWKRGWFESAHARRASRANRQTRARANRQMGARDARRARIVENTSRTNRELIARDVRRGGEASNNARANRGGGGCQEPNTEKEKSRSGPSGNA